MYPYAHNQEYDVVEELCNTSELEDLLMKKQRNNPDPFRHVNSSITRKHGVVVAPHLLSDKQVEVLSFA